MNGFVGTNEICRASVEKLNVPGTAVPGLRNRETRRLRQRTDRRAEANDDRCVSWNARRAIGRICADYGRTRSDSRVRSREIEQTLVSDEAVPVNILDPVFDNDRY